MQKYSRAEKQKIMPQDDPCRQAKWNDETITVTQSSDHDVPTLLTLTSHKIRQALYQTVTFSWILKRKWKVHHHLSTPGAFETLCLFARLLFRHVAANLAYYPGATLVSAVSHLRQLHDYHDLGRQEYYMATWKESNTWTQLSAQLSYNTGLFFCQ